MALTAPEVIAELRKAVIGEADGTCFRIPVEDAKTLIAAWDTLRPPADAPNDSAPTREDLRDSVADYRDPATTPEERQAITAWWAQHGIANQFAAAAAASSHPCAGAPRTV